MSSEITICNLALSHLGESATVASINPPEGSAQAQHCATYYPMARDSLLEMYSWGFATKRSSLALLSSGYPEWDYCYAMPNGALNILAILPADASDDYSANSQYVTQFFSCETLDDGTPVIYTDLENAVCRYTVSVDDASKFSPLFSLALSWHLASMLAGALIKGSEGAAEAKRCVQAMQLVLSQAQESDAAQRRINPAPVVPWIAGR